MSNLLGEIFERQLQLQRESFGVDPGQLEDAERADYVRSMTLALMDELHEALAEVGWKPWASGRHLNRDAFVSELIDALHFLVNLFLVAGATSNEVAIKYFAKAAKNENRQAAGYDGVSGKCATCHRALDDIGVTCTTERCGAA